MKDFNQLSINSLSIHSQWPMLSIEKIKKPVSIEKVKKRGKYARKIEVQLKDCRGTHHISPLQESTSGSLF